MKIISSPVLFILSLLVFGAGVYYFWDYSIDDAFVTFRYAENFAGGHGLRFNLGDKAVEGYSNFLWLLLLSALYGIGLPTYLTAKVLGVLFFALSGWLWTKIEKELSFRFPVPAGALFLLAPVTAFWAVSGLELGLHTFLISGAILLLLRYSRLAWIPLALLVLSRPEGVVISLAMATAGGLMSRDSKTDKRFGSLSGIVVVLLVMAALVAFRMAVFGHPLPNTYYAKAESSTAGWLELGKFALYMLPLTLLLLLVLYSSLRNGEFRRWEILFALIFLLQAAVSVRASAVMNLHFRYLIPVLPLFLVAALKGWELLRPGWKKPVLAIMFISVFSPVFAVTESVAREKEIMAAQHDLIAKLKATSENTRISITDAGRIPYYTDRYFYDIWGLNSEDIAHKGFNPTTEYFRFPDYFIFVGHIANEKLFLRFGKEELIYQNRGFKECYPLVSVSATPGADISRPGYYYLTFARNQQAVDSLLTVAGKKYLIGQ